MGTQKLGTSGWRRVAVATFAGAALVLGIAYTSRTALADGSESVAVAVSGDLEVNQNVTVTASGDNSVDDDEFLAVFAQPSGTCADDLEDEEATGTATEVGEDQDLADGTFSDAYSFSESSAGTYAVCAYVFTNPSIPADAEASTNFTVTPQSTSTGTVSSSGTGSGSTGDCGANGINSEGQGGPYTSPSTPMGTATSTTVRLSWRLLGGACSWFLAVAPEQQTALSADPLDEAGCLGYHSVHLTAAQTSASVKLTNWTTYFWFVVVRDANYEGSCVGYSNPGADTIDWRPFTIYAPPTTSDVSSLVKLMANGWFPSDGNPLHEKCTARGHGRWTCTLNQSPYAGIANVASISGTVAVTGHTARWNFVDDCYATGQGGSSGLGPGKRRFSGSRNVAALKYSLENSGTAPLC